MFNDLMVKAYGEEYPLGDLATTVVQGSNSLLIKVFDESVKEEVYKSLTRSEYELSATSEGPDIRVKLGTSRKEHVQTGLSKVKELSQQFKQEARTARHKIMEQVKKLKKVLPEDETKVLENEIADQMKKADDRANQTCSAKEADIQKV